MKVVAVSIIVVFFVSGLTLLAAPMPPQHVVNHTTKECATILGGDECMDCYPPEGWQVVDGGEGWCPEGFAPIQHLGERCEPLKDRFCCTEGHSGVHGDCEDLVLHEKRKQCAFVDDIHTGELPEGWGQRPEDLVAYRWSCPVDYEWVSTLETATVEPESTAGLEPTTEVVEKQTGSQGGGLPCPAALLLGPAALGLLLVRGRN